MTLRLSPLQDDAVKERARMALERLSLEAARESSRVESEIRRENINRSVGGNRPRRP